MRLRLRLVYPDEDVTPDSRGGTIVEFRRKLLHDEFDLIESAFETPFRMEREGNEEYRARREGADRCDLFAQVFSEHVGEEFCRMMRPVILHGADEVFDRFLAIRHERRDRHAACFMFGRGDRKILKLVSFGTYDTFLPRKDDIEECLNGDRRRSHK